MGSGAVTPEPVGAVLLPTAWLYAQGTVVTLTASPESGWYLSEWSGGVGGASSPVSVTMMGDVMVTATFRQDGFDIYLPLVLRNL